MEGSNLIYICINNLFCNFSYESDPLLSDVFDVSKSVPKNRASSARKAIHSILDNEGGALPKLTQQENRKEEDCITTEDAKPTTEIGLKLIPTKPSPMILEPHSFHVEDLDPFMKFICSLIIPIEKRLDGLSPSLITQTIINDLGKKIVKANVDNFFKKYNDLKKHIENARKIQNNLHLFENQIN